MGSEKENNKKVGWDCDNDSHGNGTVCKPICGPGAFPTGTNNVCVCDKKNECKWKGYIKDHCQRKSHSKIIMNLSYNLYDIPIKNICKE